MASAPMIPLMPAPPLGGWTRSQIIELADRRTERRGSKTLDLNSELLLALQTLILERRWSWRRKISMFQIRGGQWQYDLTLTPPKPVGVLYASANFIDGPAPSVITAQYLLADPSVLQTSDFFIGQKVVVQGVEGYTGYGRGALAALKAAPSTRDPGTPTTPAAEMGHNVSAYLAYNAGNLPANFTGLSYISTINMTMVDSAQMDDSMNPVTPAHVSSASVKSLLPNYSGPWYAHLVPWFGSSSHISNGTNCHNPAWTVAMLSDVLGRGFDGMIIDWYGSGSYEDGSTLLIQQQIQNYLSLTYCIMIDQGCYSTTAELEAHLAYIRAQYFSDMRYQSHNGLPVVYFFGEKAGVDYATAKASVGISMFWIFEGPGAALQSFCDGTFGWPSPYTAGVNSADPYNLAADNSYLSQVSGGKPCVPHLSPGFNGTLTKNIAWSLGKYLPRDSGQCWLTKAANLNSQIPANMIGLQVATWNDWEEGSQIESPIQNDIIVAASLTGSLLQWSISGGTGDESTLNSYRVIADDGINTFVIYNEATGGAKTLDLSTISGWTTGLAYGVYVIALGVGSIRNQVSNTASYTPAEVGPPPPPPPPLPVDPGNFFNGIFTIWDTDIPNGTITLQMGMTPGTNAGNYVFQGLNGIMVNAASLNAPDARNFQQFVKHGVRFYPNPGNPRQWGEITPLFERDLQMAAIYENTYYPNPKPPSQYFLMPGAFLVLCLTPLPDRNYPITIDFWQYPNLFWDSVPELIPIIPAYMHSVLLKRLEAQIFRYTLGEGTTKYQATIGEYNTMVANFAGMDGMVPGEHMDYSADDDYESRWANAQNAIQSTV